METRTDGRPQSRAHIKEAGSRRRPARALRNERFRCCQLPSTGEFPMPDPLVREQSYFERGFFRAGDWVGTDENRPPRSDLTLYTLDLAPESDSGATSLAVTVSSVQSHQTVPFPAKLAQNAESVYLLWKGDLLAPIAGLPADQRRHVKEIKVRVKTPTPRIVAYETPEGFEAHQQTGSATLTFTSKPGVDFSTLSEQVRCRSGLVDYPGT